MKYRFLRASIALSSLSFSTLATDFIDPNQLPEWFSKSLVQEKELGESRPVPFAAFGLNLMLPGKVQNHNTDDPTYWYHTIDIGTGTAIECYSFTEYDGTANSLHAIVQEGVNQSAVVNQMKLNNQFNFALDTGMIGNSPYILEDRLYILENEKNKTIGVVKGMSATTEQGLHICIHNEIGYRETFKSVFTNYLSGFQNNENKAGFFEPVYQVSFNGMPIGFSREIYTVDQDGDVEIVNDSSYLIPVSANEMASSDSVSNSWSSPDGSLINANEYAVENSTLGSNFAIQVKDDKWFVQGELQGKAVESELQYDGWLLSGFGSYIKTKALMESDAESAEYYMWSSEADPVTALKVTMTKIHDDPQVNMLVDMGPVKMRFKVAENGIIERALLEQGPLKMNLELVHVRGVPKLP